MLINLFERTARAALRRSVGTRVYPAVVAAVAFSLTVTMSVPFAPVLFLAVLLNPKRWRSIAFWASVGSAAGALVVHLAFHYLGWRLLAAYSPDLTGTEAWLEATRWMSRYGSAALLIISATPVPQTPALIFSGIYRLPILEVFPAFLVGKLVKYGVYAYLAATFRERFQWVWDRHGEVNDAAGPSTPKTTKRHTEDPTPSP